MNQSLQQLKVLNLNINGVNIQHKINKPIKSLGELAILMCEIKLKINHR